MKPRIRSTWYLVIAVWLLVAGVAAAQNGIILDQQLNASNQGYTVIRVWGSHYEMGYAQASFLGDYLERLMTEAGGNVSQAARLSGIPRQNLYGKLQQHGLDPDGFRKS